MQLGNNTALASNTVTSKAPAPLGMSATEAQQLFASFSSPVVLIDSGLSLIDQGYSPPYTQGGGIVTTFNEKGMLNWLRRLTMQGFESPYTAGISGSTVQEIQDNVYKDIINRPGYPRPHAVLIQTGGNDINAVQGYAAAETRFTEMKWRMRAYIDVLLSYGIWPIIATMPNNGLWQLNNHALWLQDKWTQYLLELERQLPVSVLNFDPLMCFPEYQPKATITGTSSGTTRTITHTAHGYNSGDRVTITASSPDPVYQNTPTGSVITVVDVNTYTYTGVGNSTNATNGAWTYTAQRVNIIQSLTSDGTTHYNAKVASKAARSVLTWFKAKFPPRDFLSARDTDFTNLVGAATSATRLHATIGMFDGTSGARTGTPTPTGSVGDGWTVNVAGGAPTSVTCAKVAYTEEGFENYTWQEVAIVAAAAEARVDIQVQLDQPSEWAAVTAASAGSWVRPTGIATAGHRNFENDMWYVCTTAGTTGLAEPTWPKRAGETVIDGAAIWECRQGFIPGKTMLFLAADVSIPVCDTDGLVSLTAELRNMTTASASLRDFSDSTQVDVPYYKAGDRIRLCTPKAVMAADSGSTRICFRTRVAAGKSVTIRLGRATCRKVEPFTY